MYRARKNRHASFAIAVAVLFCTNLCRASNCHYVATSGIVNATGMDTKTYAETPIWAQLKFADGLASELYVENHDSQNPIYFSGTATGTNQYNAGTGRTGEQVAPGGQTHFQLSIYQSRANPVTQIDVTWQYCASAIARKAWSAKPKQRGQSTPELEAALLAAIKGADNESAITALQSGASPDANDARYGYTALMLAARKNNFEIVEVLLEAGADPNRKANDGYTALLFSANCGDAGLQVAQTLLKAGADPKARQNRGYSALGIIAGGTAPQMEALLRRSGVPE